FIPDLRRSRCRLRCPRQRSTCNCTQVCCVSRRATPLRLIRTGFVPVLLTWMVPGAVAGQSPSCGGIHVTILNIRNSNGTVDCALFDGPKGFPTEVLHSATKFVAMKVSDMQARCDFENIAPGTYALVVVHDENMNGKLDTSWLGIPKEGYGFSNDAQAASTPPPFSKASCTCDDGLPIDLTIKLSRRVE